MIRLARSLALLAALFAAAPVSADQILPPGRFTDKTGSGDILFGALKFGKRQAGETSIQPDSFEIQGPGSTQDVSAMGLTEIRVASGQSLSGWLSSAVFGVPTVSRLRAYPLAHVVTGLVLSVSGYYAQADGGEGEFVWSPTSVAADNSGTVIKPAAVSGAGRWLRRVGGQPLSARWFGAKGDGTADDTTALQALLTAGAGKIVDISSGTFKITNRLLVSDDTTVQGNGTILHPESHALWNAGRPSGRANYNITVDGLRFDAGGTADGAISMICVNNSTFKNLKIGNINPAGVTVGIGIGGSAAQPCVGISISDCYVNAPDYGIVIEANVGGTVEDVIITGSHLISDWGSAASLSRNVRRVSIVGNSFKSLGLGVDLFGRTGVGIGLKIWNGENINNAPSDIAVNGNTFFGPSVRNTEEGGVAGVAIGGWSNNVVVSGNTFRSLTIAFGNNFSGKGATNIEFNNNVVRDGDRGVLASMSSDTHLVINGNVFENLSLDAISASLNYSTVNGNRFSKINGKAIHAQIGNVTTVVGNQAYNIGEEFFFMAANASSSALVNIASNSLVNIGNKTNATYNVIQLNDQPHVIDSNVIRSTGPNLPAYIVGRGTASAHCVITGNWMFGARSGYMSLAAGASDIYANNKERGGIGP